MKNVAELEKKIVDLEYRLRLIEKFLDLSNGYPFITSQDESSMNSLRLNIMQGMEKEGINVDQYKKIWGTKFNRKG